MVARLIGDTVMTTVLENYKEHDELDTLRERLRSNSFTNDTSGLMPGIVQGNVAILPSALAEEFLHYCSLNPVPCPVIGFSEPGNPTIPALGSALDIRTDVPEYCIFRDGELDTMAYDLKQYWQDDSVAIILG